MADVKIAENVPPRSALSPRKVAQLWGERLGIALIILGVAGLIQPWVQGFFTNGFSVLIAGTLIFIIASHL